MSKVRKVALLVLAGLAAGGVSAHVAGWQSQAVVWPSLWSQLWLGLEQAPVSARAWALLPAGLLGLGFIGRNQHGR